MAESFRTIVGRFDEARANNDQREIERLARILMPIFVNIARKRTKGDLPNQGRELVQEAAHTAYIALLKPSSPNGTSLRQDPAKLVTSRTIDAFRSWNSTERKISVDSEAGIAHASMFNWSPLDATDFHEALRHALATLPTELHRELRKMLAGKPAGSKKANRNRKKIRAHFAEAFDRPDMIGFETSFEDDELQHQSEAMDPNPSRFDIAMAGFGLHFASSPTDATIAHWAKAFPQFAEEFQIAACLERGDFGYLDKFDTDPEHTKMLVDKYVALIMQDIEKADRPRVTS